MKKEKRNKEEIKMRKEKKFEDRYAKGIHFDIRSKGSCFITPPCYYHDIVFRS